MDVPHPDNTLCTLMAETAKAIAHPARIAILINLRNGEKTVTELVAATHTSQSNLSQHLAFMRNRQIVKTRKEGAKVYYTLANAKVADLCDLIHELLEEQLVVQEAIARNY